MLKRNPAPNHAPSAQVRNPAPFVERARESSGQPLDAATRERMETRLAFHFAQIPILPPPRATAWQIVDANDQTEHAAEGVERVTPLGETWQVGDAPRVDFANVRVHTDAFAHQSARALNALAFTVGRDIFFAAGQYMPNTHGGEQLLAHELAHVVQSQSHSAPMVIQRKAATKALPPADALQVALDGDDDATRDLTHNPEWNELEVTPEQSAILIIHLLDGFTGDDDENAGLDILRKDIGQGILDDTLLALNKRGRFGQLLDDYDGSEYRDLLVLLSNNILTQRVRARYLDEFVQMTWVREHEERAIVKLLERTSSTDRADLLEPKFREEGLRDAIDTDELSVCYEELVHDAFGERAKQVSRDKQRWTKIFDEEAKKCIRKGLGKPKDDEMLQRALTDVEKEVAQEVSDYVDAILHETIRPFGSPDPDKLAGINRGFRKKMDSLLERKRAEFCHELRWGIEFNQNLDAVNRVAWTKDDLDEMDKILSAIPDEILHADPKFTAFLRERERPGKKWLWGETESSSDAREGKITLLHDVRVGVLAHELGHVIHDVSPQLLVDFQNLSAWEFLDDQRIDALKKGDKKNDKDFEPMLARLEEKRKKDGDTRAECGEKYKDDFFYLYNRYGAGYWRYPVKRAEGAEFVSDYAGTHPQDDFAETFSEYLVNSKRLRKKEFRQKYRFMHVEVFVRFWLLRQFRRVNDDIEKIISTTLDKFPPQDAFVVRLRDGFVQQLWDKFFDTENDLIRARTAEAENEKFDTPVPLRGSTEARDVTAVLVSGARDLMALAEKVIQPHAQFGNFLMSIFLGVDASLEDAFKSLWDKLTNDFEFELWEQFEPLAERILKGEHIVRENWSEVNAITAQMNKVPGVIEGYLNTYNDLIQARLQLFTFVRDELLKLKDGSQAKVSFRLFSIERIKWFNEAMQRVQSNVRAGVPFDASAFGNPKQQAAQDVKDITAFKRTLKP